MICGVEQIECFFVQLNLLFLAALSETVRVSRRQRVFLHPSIDMGLLCAAVKPDTCGVPYKFRMLI